MFARREDIYLINDMKTLRDRFEQTIVNFENTFHDIITPLSSIMAISQLMGKDARDGEQTAAYATRIAKNGETILGIINDGVLSSRRNARRDIKKEDLSSFLRGLLDSLTSLFDKKGIETRFVGRRSLICEFNKTALERVVLNIVSNAIKHTPDGGRLSLRLVSGRGAVTIRVTDSGPGIPDEEIPYAFERYYSQGCISLTEPGGIGLTVVKDIAASFGGSARAENCPDGCGLRVTLTLPIICRGD